ncbi:unnamed protein product [Somion occarium]|uniref:Methyltransferase domain-containing protein n=1 Tax=Somion occarium TaxID=3059160 RepID=A0ABP1DYD6_9APHY
MLAPYPVRLRSSSNPPCPRPLNVETTTRPTNQHKDTPHTTTATSPRSPKFKVNPLAAFASPTSSQTSRRFFRIRRPSSSTPAPPRPSRNPARQRPQSSSGVPLDSEKLHFFSPQQSIPPPVHYVKIPLEGAGSITFPMPPSDAGILRRRSRRKPPLTVTTSISTPESTEPGFQFSTADRTILEELKSKMKARDSQFQLRCGKKHHIYPASEVPYPINYERDVLDNDIWETRWNQQVCGSVTWHDFEEPPSRVLDLGCGVGTWILDCARLWKDTHFVGLDIVPIQPDLQQVGSSQLASRVTWVQANFLEGLPFQDEEFDYVHIKRIARGVPEDKWDALLEEISRVMKPSGRIEIIEEDLYLPGRLRDSQDSLPPRTYSPPPSIVRPRAPTPASSFRPMSINLGRLSDVAPRPSVPLRRSTEPLPALLSRRPTDDAELALDIAPIKTETSTKPRLYGDFKPPVNPRDHSLLDFIYTEMHSARFVNMQPLSLLANSFSIYFKDVRTHPPLIASFPPRPSQLNRSPSTPATPSLESDADSDTEYGSPPSSKCLSRSSSVRRGPNSPVELLSLNNLLENSNPFVTLDESRYNAFSPSTRSAFGPILSRRPSRLAKEPSVIQEQQFPRRIPSSTDMKINRLPNKKLDIHVGSLNLHLSLRVHEVLACSEAMWDYVLDYQRKHRKQTRSNDPSKLRKKPQEQRAAEPFHTTLMKMTRWKFNTMLEWFEFDMRDHIGLAPAVRTQLGWAMPVPMNTRDKSSRHEFDKLCREWAQYQNDPVAYFASLQPPASDNGGISSSDDDVIARTLGIHGGRSSNERERTKRSRGSSTTEQRVDWEPEVPPTERLSRTLRVLVAWKA